MEENQRDKLNKKLTFWQEVLKMIQLLSLYFFLYYSFSLIVAVFGLQGNTMRYVGILAYLVCGSVVFFLLPKDHRKLIPRVSGSETSGEKTDALSSLLLALSVIMNFRRKNGCVEQPSACVKCHHDCTRNRIFPKPDFRGDSLGKCDAGECDVFLGGCL